MAIDYALQFPCAVRKDMPEPKLQAMVKHMATAQFAIAKIREAEPNSDLDTIVNKYTVELMVTGPDGTARQTPVTIAQLLALCAPLGEVQEHCKACRANVADRDFGCFGKINYPIPGEAEEWLLSRLPDDEKDPNFSLLMKFLADLEIDGAPVDVHRSRAQMFELKKPFVRTWGGWLGKKQITSSQILHMLAFGGMIGPEQAQLYTNMLGLTTILSEPHPQSDVVEQFKTLACAIVMAGRLNAKIDVDA